jgi:hypothetical protein
MAHMRACSGDTPEAGVARDGSGSDEASKARRDGVASKLAAGTADEGAAAVGASIRDSRSTPAGNTVAVRIVASLKDE